MLFKKYFLNIFFVTLFYSLYSCSNFIDDRGVGFAELPDKYSRLLVYLHLESSSQAQVSFNLESLSIENLSSGQWESLLTIKKNIVSSGLESGQKKLSEVIIPPGSYGKIKLDVKDAYVVNINGEKIALKSDKESFYFNVGLDLKDKESHLLQLGWDHEGSIVRENVFEPIISFFPQKPLSRGLSVFVANSGSNYVSVIDKDLERVVGAITVGRTPMGMALNIMGGRLYVVNQRDATVSVIDIYNHDVFETIDISSVSINPVDVVFLPSDGQNLEGKLYIVNKFSNDVTVVDTGSAKIIKTISVGLAPSNIALDKSRKELYVSNEGSNSLTIISALSDTVSATVGLGHSPLGVVAGEGMIYVLCGEVGGIKVFSPSTRAVIEEIATANAIYPHRGAVVYDKNLYVTNKDSSEISLFDEFGVFIQNIDVGRSPTGVAGDVVK